MTEASLSSHVMLSGAWTRGVLNAFERLDIDTAGVCRHAGLDEQQLRDPEARLPRDSAGRLWRAALEVTGDRFLGLHAGNVMAPRGNHLLGLLVVNSETLSDGMRTALRYQEILTHGRVISIEESGHLVQLIIHRVEDDLPVTPNEIEFIAVTLVKFLSFATFDAFRLERVQFAHPYRGSIEEYERLFGCPIAFGEASTILFIPPEIYSLKLRGADKFLQSHLQSAAAEMYQRIRVPGFLSTVSSKIGTLLPGGQCDVEAVARALHLSRRTLQRRLQEEGTSFREVLDITRHSIVIEGLERHQSHDEIAQRVGLANPRALSRAIRRWNTEGNHRGD